jgi:DNA-binding GntR family transcriptional regulator
MSGIDEKLGSRANPQRRTRAVDLAERLERMILEGELTPGDRLDETALAARFGVSRTPVREALKQLAAIGIVRLLPHQGAMVAALSVGQILETFEVVAELEAFAARLAARRMTPGEAQHLLAAHAACGAPGIDADGFYRANRVFHLAIHAACGNAVLAEEIDRIDKRLVPYRRLITFRPGRIGQSLDEHQAIVDALLVRDEERAAAAMRQHLRVLGEDVLALSRAVA